MKAVVIRTFDRASQARKAAARERIVTLKAEASGALRSGLSALNATIDRRAYLVGCVEAVRLALALEVGACEAGSILAKEAGEAFGRLGARKPESELAETVFGGDPT